MNVVLWVLQILLAAVFAAHGWMLLAPPPDLLAIMNEQMGVPFRIFLGIAEVAGAIGLILPALTRIRPWLTPLAAACLAFVVLSATVLHLMRAEYASALDRYQRVFSGQVARKLPTYPVERTLEARARAGLGDHEGARAVCIALLEELHHALHPPVHEGRVPASGVIVHPTVPATRWVDATELLQSTPRSPGGTTALDRAREHRQRVVYAEGEEETVLRAVQTVVDEGLAHPILIGRPEVIENRIEKLGLRLEAGRDFDLTNILDDPRFHDYWQQFHAMSERRGVTPDSAKNLMRSRPALIAAMMVERGEADAMLCGMVGRFHKKLSYIRAVLPLERGVQCTSAMTGVVSDRGLWFFLDTHVQEDPTAEQLAEATIQGAYRLKLFGIEPRVALLSHSNYGSHSGPSAVKMRRVREILAERAPKLEVDGEMMPDTAWDEPLRRRIFPNTTLSGEPNLLVLPNLDAANITYNMVRVMTDGAALGPILMGVAAPVHIMTPTATPRRVINMTAIAAVEAQIRKARGTPGA